VNKSAFAYQNPVILIVDDDEEDIYLTRRAFRAQSQDIVFNSVRSGAELFDYLNREGPYSDDEAAEIPLVILMDINIPKENGFEILERLKQDPKFSYIPVVMLTTSDSTEDIQKAYSLGASSYICKSVNAAEMKENTAQFCRYWLEFAKLPKAG